MKKNSKITVATVNVEFENAIRDMLEGTEWIYTEDGKIRRRQGFSD